MAGSQHDEHDNRLSLELVRYANRRRLQHRRMRRRGGLDFSRSHPLARDLERVVAAALDVTELIRVDPRPIAVHPHIGKATPVRGEILLGIAPEAARHAGPRFANDELADRTTHRAATIID